MKGMVYVKEMTYFGFKSQYWTLVVRTNLLNYPLDIAEKKNIIMRRPNAQDLLKIRRREIDLERFMQKAEEIILKVDELFKKK